MEERAEGGQKAEQWRYSEGLRKKRESLGLAEDGQWRCSGGLLGRKELEVARRWGSGGAQLGSLLGENPKWAGGGAMEVLRRSYMEETAQGVK